MYTSWIPGLWDHEYFLHHIHGVVLGSIWLSVKNLVKESVEMLRDQTITHIAHWDTHTWCVYLSYENIIEKANLAGVLHSKHAKQM
jgi:hypothetical protein